MKALCSALGMIDEFRKGMPSALTPFAVTAPSLAGGQPRNALSDPEIRERMSGNLCRCGAYGGINAAIAAVLSQEAVS